MVVDPRHLAQAKAALQRIAAELPVATFRGISAEAFDREDLLLMLSVAMDISRRERKAQDVSMRLMETFAEGQRNEHGS